MNPLVGGTPIIVNAPITAQTAVIGIFPARPPSLAMLRVPTLTINIPAVMKRSPLPSACEIYIISVPARPYTDNEPRPNKR